MRRFLALVVLCGMAAGPVDPPGKPKHTNRLAREISPYLLQHAHNPVDWFPWGEEAFAKARKEGKLVFLSIGYSSCHWCHVMEKESFEDVGTAKILNENYVCIKVDREERPDIDQIYMTALQVLGQGGGWPLSMFLTPDGKPIVGGTYWPREDRTEDGRTIAGFKSVLQLVRRYQQQKRDELQARADKLAGDTAQALAGLNRGAALVSLDRALVSGAIDEIKGEFDREHGGFGTASKNFRGTKFPMPPYLALLQAEAARAKTRDLDDIVQITLDHVARGGIYDHLGGGFHRYSTERTWTVPHFEKMLYDNAQLLEIYARAFRETKRPLYRRVLEQSWAFVGEMTSPEGAFYSALDADSAGAEGRFYVWTNREVDAVLGDGAEAAVFKKVYGADRQPNFEEQYFIFTMPRPLGKWAGELGQDEDALERRLALDRGKLLAARARRPRPFRDTKVLTAWNGQMIAGAALAGQALDDRAVVAAAGRAAEFLLKTMKTPDGRLLRSYGAVPGQKAQARLTGYLDDYAYFIHGLLTLHDVTNETRWLDQARQLSDTMVKFYADRERGGFYYTANDQEKLFARAKDQYDGAQPSANSMAAQNFVRLWRKTGEARFDHLAEKTIRGFSAQLKVNPSSLTALAQALAMYLDQKEIHTK